jgi:hypothetical protein
VQPTKRPIRRTLTELAEWYRRNASILILLELRIWHAREAAASPAACTNTAPTLTYAWEALYANAFDWPQAYQAIHAVHIRCLP